MSVLIRIWSFLQKTVRDFLNDDCIMQAASMAYYAIFSIPPLIMIVLTVAGTLWGAQLSAERGLEIHSREGEQAVRGHLEQELDRLLGESGKNQVIAMLNQSRGTTGCATLFHALFLVVASTGFMYQLQTALNRVWEIERERSGGIRHYLVKRGFSLLMLMVLAALLLTSLILTTALSGFLGFLQALVPESWTVPLAVAGNAGTTMLIVTLLLAAMFRWLPDAHVEWRDVWVGAGVTGALFLAGKNVLAWYLARRDFSSYGEATGALVSLLMWTYYITLILLYGAEFTRSWAGLRAHRPAPEEGAVRVVREKRVERSSGTA